MSRCGPVAGGEGKNSKCFGLHTCELNVHKYDIDLKRLKTVVCL